MSATNAEYEERRRIAAVLTKLTDLTQVGKLRWKARRLDRRDVMPSLMRVGTVSERYEAELGGDGLRVDALEPVPGGFRFAGTLPVRLYVREGTEVDYKDFPPAPYFSTFDSHLMDLYRAVQSQFREVPEGFIGRVLSS